MDHHGIRPGWAGQCAGSCWLCPARAKGEPSSPARSAHTAQAAAVATTCTQADKGWEHSSTSPKVFGRQECHMGVRKVPFIPGGFPYMQKGPMSRAASARALHTHAVQGQQPEVPVSTPELDAEGRCPWAGLQVPLCPCNSPGSTACPGVKARAQCRASLEPPGHHRNR